MDRIPRDNRSKNATTSPSLALTLYFALNLTVTIFNKVLLETPCPFALTGVHATATALACQAWQRTPITSLKRLTLIKLLAFSLLYTVNIGISNASLGLVTLPLHQAIRATSPVLTVLVSKIVEKQHGLSPHGLFSHLMLLPIVLGAAITTWGGRYDATPVGFLLTLLGAILAVFKTVLTNQFLTKSDRGLGMSPIEMLGILTPLSATQAFFWSYLAEEYTTLFSPQIQLSAVFANATLAALLNIASFEASKRCRPLGMAVAGNLKQVVILAVPLSGVFPGVPVAIGTLLTVCGSVWYARAREEGRRIEEKGQLLK